MDKLTSHHYWTIAVVAIVAIGGYMYYKKHKEAEAHKEAAVAKV